MRWKRNKRGRVKFKINSARILLSGLILLVIIFLFLIIRSDIFIIRSIDVQVEKIDCVDSNQIRDSSYLLRQNFFLINSSKVESDLKKKFLCIKSVKPSRYFPNKIGLQVFGREPAVILVIEKKKEATQSGILEKFSQIQATPSGGASASGMTQLFMDSDVRRDDNVSFVIDNEGVVYSNHIEQINAPRVYVSGLNLTLGQKLEQDLIGNLIKILEKVKIFGVDVREAKIYLEKTLLINAIPRIIFSLDDKIDTQIASLQLILKIAKIDSEQLEFIDLRFDKPIVRFAPKR